MDTVLWECGGLFVCGVIYRAFSGLIMGLETHSTASYSIEAVERTKNLIV
jgi:hypothetical protein